MFVVVRHMVGKGNLIKKQRTIKMSGKLLRLNTKISHLKFKRCVF